MTVKLPISLTATFLWIGFVGAISFMEAWLKFRAPGITVPLGLGIGRIVFNALNKVEWVLALAVLIDILISRQSVFKLGHMPYLIPVALLIVQTVWLLPTLNARAQLHIDGANVPPSNLHFWFVAIEVVKVTSLFLFGLSLFKSAN